MTEDGSGTRTRAEKERSQRLGRGAAAISEDASCVGHWQVDRLRAETGSDVTAAEARDALERCGVRVAELPSLPAGPPRAIARHADYAEILERLGHKLSVELVFGDGIADGFSLLGGIRLGNGRRLNQEAVEEALGRTPPAARHGDWKRALSVLADSAREQGALDDIVFWEVTQVLRPLARLGYSQRAITEQAVRLSLNRDQAEILAAAVAEEHQMREPPRPAAELPVEQGAVTADRSPEQDTGREPSSPAAAAVTREFLKPITDLQVRSVRGRTDVVQLSWTPPADECVLHLRMAGDRAPWQLGETIARSEADSYGRPLNASGVLGPDRRMACEVAVPQERTFVTAITIGNAGAAVGRTVELTRDAPVRGLTQRRFGEEVRLTWTWPDEATSAYVAWQPSAAAGDPHGSPPPREQRRCSKRAFDAEGGFTAVMGHAAQRVEVWAVITTDGEEHFTVPAEIEVPAMAARVRCDFLPAPGLLNGFRRLAGRRRRLQLQLLAELPCVLPDLVVVQCKHPAVPLAPHHYDEIVERITGRSLDPDTPVRVPIPLEGGERCWMACFVDPAKSAAARGRVALVPPPGGWRRW